MNEDRGGIAKKICSVACTGCTLCFKVCPFEAIEMNNNLAFIDSEKCRLCRKCTPVCPTGSIIEVGFPPKKEEAEGAQVNKSITSASDNSEVSGDEINNKSENQ